jgi:hypothetical protein
MQRLLDIEAISHYCGVSANTFLKYCPVRPLRLGRCRLWDVRAVNHWLDELQCLMPAPANDDHDHEKLLRLLDEERS